MPSYDFKIFSSNLLHVFLNLDILSYSLLSIPTPSYAFDRFFNIPIFAFLPLPTLSYALLRIPMTSSNLPVIYCMLSILATLFRAFLHIPTPF